MKPATAMSGKTSRKPQASEAMAPSAVGKATADVRVRPMLRSPGLTAASHRFKPQRLRENEGPLPPVSRLIYRAGGVLVR